MAFPYTEVNAYTQTYKIPKLVDQIYKSNVLFDRMNKSGRIIVDGGSQIEQPLEYAKGNGGIFDGAYDVVDTAHKKIADYAVLSWKFKYAEADITLKDQVMNRGNSRIINLVDSRVASMRKTLADLIGTGIYSAGTDTTEMDGLRLAVDTGNTYAGIAQGTYTWWAAASEATDTTLTTTLMNTMFGACYNTSGEYPTIIVCTQAIWNSIWVLLQAKTVGTNLGGDQAGIGWRSMLFNGIPVVADNHCPTSHMFFLNENHLKLFVSAEADFKFTGWKEPVNQPGASIAYILWAGNILLDAPRTCGKFSSLTA